jgi:ribosome modulation factor
MAEALRDAGVGHNLTRPTFIEFCTKHDEVEKELAEIAETRRSLNRRRKDLRKNMGAAGIDIEMFDRMRADLDLTPEEREAQQIDYVRYMEWMRAPVGFQPSMDLQTDDPGERAFNVHELHAIDGEGFDAGRNGRRRDSNPYRPGTEAHQRWDNAWGRGQQVAVEAMGGEDAPKRRGRKPGSKNRPKDAAAENGAAANGHDAEAENGEGEADPMPTEPPPPMAAGAASGEGEPPTTRETAPQVH